MQTSKVICLIVVITAFIIVTVVLIYQQKNISDSQRGIRELVPYIQNTRNKTEEHDGYKHHLNELANAHKEINDISLRYGEELRDLRNVMAKSIEATKELQLFAKEDGKEPITKVKKIKFNSEDIRVSKNRRRKKKIRNIETSSESSESDRRSKRRTKTKIYSSSSDDEDFLSQVRTSRKRSN